MVKLLQSSFVWVALCCAALYGMLELGFRTWLPTFNTKVFRLSQAESVLGLTIFAGAIALSRLLLGYLQQWFSWLAIQLTYLTSAALLTFGVLQLTTPDSLNSPVMKFAVVLAFLFAAIGFLSKHLSIHTAFYFMLLPIILLPILLISYNQLANRFSPSE